MEAKKFDRYFDKIFWAMLVAIAGWVGHSLNMMTDSVNSLNIKMAVVVEQVSSHEERVKSLEGWREQAKWISHRR